MLVPQRCWVLLHRVSALLLQTRLLAAAGG
jgi:hypothetical protein